MADHGERPTSIRLTSKLLMPVVATAVSAAATYAGKRAPQLLQEKVWPRLRDAASGSDDLAGGLADRAKAVVRGSSDGRRRLSDHELDQRLRERAQHRQARRSGARS